ncbi:glycosyltransferase family 2 protein [Hymenobacter sp. APR13]|uniref:glycosyltransferase family 2 protein n=1 Tax=Hymenobacter sp. APR13 TaxID=1356852 RepID=UPI0018CFC4E2|nr:glycosyltransferase family 2 protein [Hymenobacter sp. APR13]
MTNTPFFSIVTPTYNRANLIGLTLDSVLAQKFEAWELLIVDDGSKDETAAVVQPYLADPRIQYLSKENAERGAARNYGLARARGEYVIFLDSDDRLHPTHLTTLKQKIAELGQPAFIATKYDFDRDGQRRPSDLSSLPAGPLGFEAFLDGNPLACNICIRRLNPSLYLFEEDRRYAAVEDWMFMLENTQHGGGVQLVDAVTLTMNDHDQRSMRADNQGLIRRLELAAGWMEQHLTLTAGQRRRLLGRVYYLCSIHSHIDGFQAQAMRHALRAIPGLPLRAGVELLIRCAAPPALVQWAKRRMDR